MRQLAKRILIIEPLVIAIVVAVFWFPDVNRVWALLLLLPLLLLRLLVYHRLVAYTPLNIVLLVFLVLGIINVYAAPFRYDAAHLQLQVLGWDATVPWLWTTLGRPIMGMALMFSIVEGARRSGLTGPLIVSVLVALLVAYIALVSTQWNSKSNALRFIIDGLPAMARDVPAESPNASLGERLGHQIHSAVAFIAPGGFNANEIAGGLAWLIPLCAGLALYRWRFRPLQIGAIAAFVLLLLALYLGQSRLALIGVIVALGALIFALIPPGRKRVIALLGLALFIALEGAVAFNVFNTVQAESIQERDEGSFGKRLLMWEQVLYVLRDYPLTGVGMNMFRARQVRAVYPVPSYENRVLPHAHNEFFQVAADLGIPGLLIFVTLYVVVGWMVVRIWRQGDAAARTIAAATAAGLLAHMIYGMGDAVALWDRFTFVFWLLLGLLCAQYVLVRQLEPEVRAKPMEEAVTANL